MQLSLDAGLATAIRRRAARGKARGNISGHVNDEHSKWLEGSKI
jgi:hypothetical protein